ncbi:hypothetical protein FRC01_013398, partial [Tulasnella sp. 417]
MTPSTSNHTQAAISNKKRKQPVSVQSSPAPRKKIREDPSVEESSEKGPPSTLEDSERGGRRVDKGKAKASVDNNEKAAPKNGTMQPGSATARAKQAKERQSSTKKAASSSYETGTSQTTRKPNRRKLAPQRPWPS